MNNCENCTNCNEIKKVELQESTEKLPETIPYIVYQAEMHRQARQHEKEIERAQKEIERAQKEIERSDKHTIKWMVAFFVCLALFFGTNVGWIVYESQFETISYEQDGEGLNNVNVGEQGDINYGAESQSEAEESQ